MRALLTLIMLISAVPMAFADAVIIRKSDGLVAGIAHGRQDRLIELQNIVNSELGGAPNHYEIIETNQNLHGKKVTADADGNIEIEEHEPSSDATTEIPLSDFGAGLTGAAAALAAQGFVIKAKKRRGNQGGNNG